MDAGQVLRAEQSRLQESNDGSGFGPGDAVVNIKMIRQGGSEVGNVERWVEDSQLSEQEVKRHHLVRNEGMDAGGDESLNRDGRRAMANDDGGVLRVIRLVNGGSGGSGHHVGESSNRYHAM